MNGPLLALLAALAPALAPAPARAYIPDSFWERPDSTPHDLGNGLVGEVDNRDLPEGWVEYKIIAQCGTGLRIETRLDPALSDLDRGNLARQAEEIAKAAVASPEEIPFDRLVPLLAGLGETRLVQSRRESYGCAEHYPELRGDKAPWTSD
jgi:hypothetical protein